MVKGDHEAIFLKKIYKMYFLHWLHFRPWENLMNLSQNRSWILYYYGLVYNFIQKSHVNSIDIYCFYFYGPSRGLVMLVLHARAWRPNLRHFLHWFGRPEYKIF
jgi:hypothetical protein